MVSLMLNARRHAPIVLVPGLLGFDRIGLGNIELKRYFPGVKEHLQAVGYRVRVARLSLTRGVAARAAELRRFIRHAFPQEQVHVFAHSMGGLDARFMISKLDMADHVRSLTTIGTPHRGCSFADWGVRKLAWCIQPILRLLNISADGFYDLTTESCSRFNEEVKDVPGVRYHSIAGSCERSTLGPFWHLPSKIVNDCEGANDGIVSVHSARYGERCDVWNADHLNLVNWTRSSAFGSELARNYLRLANRAVGLERSNTRMYLGNQQLIG